MSLLCSIALQRLYISKYKSDLWLSRTPYFPGCLPCHIFLVPFASLPYAATLTSYFVQDWNTAVAQTSSTAWAAFSPVVFIDPFCGPVSLIYSIFPRSFTLHPWPSKSLYSTLSFSEALVTKYDVFLSIYCLFIHVLCVCVSLSVSMCLCLCIQLHTCAQHLWRP